MDPKFLVVEIDSKEQALQMVQIMLEKGFGRLMLLDDLSKHPAVIASNSNEHKEPMPACPRPSSPVEEEVFHPPTPQESNISSTGIQHTVVKQEPIIYLEDDEEEEEEDMLLTSRVPPKRPYTEEYNEQLMNMLRAEPEIVPIGVNTSNDGPSGSNGESHSKRVRPAGEHHECQMCGVRVKTPRSGRWNLQMHVIALHCVGRQYKCKECDYLDYRKSTMRRHTLAQHGSDIPPYNITDDIMRAEWHEAMKKCFPEFAHRTGFL